MIALVCGYLFYGKFVEHVFAPDDRPTPAVTKADGLDYVPMPYWKVFMIQFLNIAGTGPIFGAIMGAKFGPAAYLWIIFGCIFAGATHDYLSGMLSMRNDGKDLPTLVNKYLGKGIGAVMLVFMVVLLLLVGAVFVYSPAEILNSLWGNEIMWIALIFVYYFIATMMPIDKIIGKVYPLFAISLIFMAIGLMVCLFIKMPDIPELWDGVDNLGKLTHPETFHSDIFPALFITIACGAISGFHATQSPLMARCILSERKGRPIFYGAMITEGLVALIWATVAMWFFYNDPEPGYAQLGAEKGFGTSAPVVVKLVCNDWLGILGGVLAMLGVVAAPITSGDTALRSARLIIAQALNLGQRPIKNRFLIAIPIFVVTFGLLMWQIGNPDGFNTIWQYFGWMNQFLSIFTLWSITIYLTMNHKPYIITLIPALFMTAICTAFLFVSPIALGLQTEVGYVAAAIAVVLTFCAFMTWKKRYQTK